MPETGHFDGSATGEAQRTGPTGTLTTSRAALSTLLTTAGAAPFAGSGPVVLAVGLAALCHFALSGRLRGPGALLSAFLAWCALSTAWSIAPASTVRSAVVLITTAVAVSFALAQLPRAQVLLSLADAVRVLVVLSWVVYLLLPAAGREQVEYHQGALKGVFVQRNTAAFVVGFGVLLFLFLASSDAWTRRSATGWALACSVTLAATESSTGAAVTVAAACFLLSGVVMARLSRSGRMLLGVTALLAAGVGLRVVTQLPSAVAVLGRDTTLTGRTVIWAAIGPYVRDRPALGHGWGALWTPDTFVTRQIWATAGFEFPHAHNAYIDLVAQTGTVGLVLLAAALLVVIVRGVRGMVGGIPDPHARLTMALAAYLAAYGASEVAFLSYFGFLLLIVATAFSRNQARTRALAST